MKKSTYHEPFRAARRQSYKKKPSEPSSQGFSSPIGRIAIRSMLEVAQIMGITKSRVHQLERRALWKIREAIKETGL